MKNRDGCIRYTTREYEFALCLILISTVCFYRLDTMLLFVLMNAVAGVIVIWKHVQQKGLRVCISPFFVWITMIFSMFLIYGTLFLRTGSFNIDRYVIAYAQCILLYCIFKALLMKKDGENRLAYGFAVAACVCVLILLINEIGILQSNDARVGASLAGNVNTVGMALGIMSLFLTYHFGKTKDKKYLLLILVVCALMLVTGSKKCIVYLVADIYVIYSFSKDKTMGKLVLLLLAGLLAYMIFGIDYFYNLIGSRIIDMLGQFGFDIPGAKYSNSTFERMHMIEEGFRFWSENPIFGGGANYFMARTITRYEYSHCNVTELLCNFGLAGTGLYYFAHFQSFASYRRIKKTNSQRASFSVILIGLVMLVDWMAVTYSGFATCYLPIIYCFVIRELSNSMSRYENERNHCNGKTGYIEENMESR